MTKKAKYSLVTLVLVLLVSSVLYVDIRADATKKYSKTQKMLK